VDWSAAPGSLGPLWVPSIIRNQVLTDPNQASGLSVLSTAAETIDEAVVGVASVESGGDVLVEIYADGDETLPPGGLSTATYRPNAGVINASNTWQNQAGSTAGIFASIDEVVLDTSDYITYQGSYQVMGRFQFNVASAGWAAGRRVHDLRLLFYASVQDTDGRVTVVHSDGTTVTPIETKTLSENVELFSVSLGELNPATRRPWTQAAVQALDAAASIGWQPLSGKTRGIRIFQAWVEIDYFTENRLAIGAGALTELGAPLWVPFALSHPGTGAANWAKANGTRYTAMIRPLAGPGVTTPRFSLRTFEDTDPARAEALSLRAAVARLDYRGSVSSIEKTGLELPSITFGRSGTADDSVDGQPYLNINLVGLWNTQTFGDADGSDYSLLRVGFLDLVSQADVAWSDVPFSIIDPAGPTVLYTGVLLADALRDAPILNRSDLIDGGGSAGVSADLKLVEVDLDPPVTLAASTTYAIDFDAPASTRPAAILMMSAYDGVPVDRGAAATYGGATWDYATLDGADAAVLISYRPDAPAGFAATAATRDPVNIGSDCGPITAPFVALTWTPTSLGADFLRYEIERSADGGTTWELISAPTDELVDAAQDGEALYGQEASYRIRVVRAVDLIESEWTDIETATPTFDGCGLVLTSNEAPGLTVVVEELGGTDEAVRTIELPEMAERETLPMYDRNYQVVLAPDERRGDAFTFDALIYAGDPTAAGLTPGRAMFDPIVALCEAPLSYIAVMDRNGRRWLASVAIDQLRQTEPGGDQGMYVARLTVVEVTDVPSVFDVVPP
jgi:hypothetical protein